MEVDYRYEHVTGLTTESYYTIGVRYDVELDHHDSYESWCVHVTPKKITISNGQASYFTGIWMAPSGEVFISDGWGVIYRNVNPIANIDNWCSDVLSVAIEGVWGLRSDFVLAWGGPDERLFQWDGRNWTDLPHPGGWIRAIHGQDERLIYAVGNAGLIARWDGSKWTRVPYKGTTLSSVVVIDDGDHIFAAGLRGELLEGSEYGITKLLHHSYPIFALAWWQEELWIGAGDGLSKLVNGKLVLVKENILARSFDARGDLLIGSDVETVHTKEGVNFQAYSTLNFGRLRVGYAALWAPELPIDIDHGHEIYHNWKT